jgi:hypothetical protein
MSQPAPTPEPEATDEAVEEEAAPLNRAERRARGRKAAAQTRTGPAPDQTLRRGRGPRSHTKRV